MIQESLQGKIEIEMDSMAVASKPHAVFIPYPAQSHIKTLLKLAKLFHHKGFHITFVNTEFNHKRFLKSMGVNSLDGLPNFRFETIPDAFPLSDVDVTKDLPAVCEAIRKNPLTPFRNLLAKLNDTVSSNVPPVTCIVSDGFMTFTITAAEELGIPVIKFFTIAACAFMGIKQYSALKDKGLTPPCKGESYLTNDELDTIIDSIPGMKDIRLRDLPSFVRTTNPNDVAMFEFSMEAAERASKATAIIVHSFDALEPDVLDALSSMFSRFYAIGPLELLLNNIPEGPLKSIGYSLWKEEHECLEWLDSKEPNSVVYVNFGSITVMTQQQLVEFGMGLANSKFYFLWIIRPDLVMGESTTLPPEFLAASKERGFVASWCPQEEVLNHPSTGGFLTHSGWGSTIESVTAGVPMLCWPFFGDQPTNCRYSCVEWEIGMEIDNDVKRDELEKLVTELMQGEKGKKMKKKVMELKKMAEKAAGPNGSSSTNLDKLVNEVNLSKC